MRARLSKAGNPWPVDAFFSVQRLAPHACSGQQRRFFLATVGDRILASLLCKRECAPAKIVFFRWLVKA